MTPRSPHKAAAVPAMQPCVAPFEPDSERVGIPALPAYAPSVSTCFGQLLGLRWEAAAAQRTLLSPPRACSGLSSPAGAEALSPIPRTSRPPADSFASADPAPPAATEEFYLGMPPAMAVLRTQVDFGALLGRALDAEATQMRAYFSGRGDTVAVSPGSSSPGAAPASPVAAPASPVDARNSAAGGTTATAATLGKKSTKGKKGKTGRLNRGKRKTERRRGQRAEERKTRSPFAFKLKARMAQRHGAPETIRVEYQARNFPANQNAYTAKPQIPVSEAPFSLQGLLDIGFEVVPWDGKETASLLDLIDCGIGNLAGQPQDPGWQSVADDAAKAFEQARLDSGLKPGQGKEGKRGHFVALAAGVTHSPQSNKQGPRYRDNSEKEQEIIDRLVATPSIQRIATFGSQSLAYYAPKVYQHYTQNLKPIYEDYGFDLLFQDSVFPSANFNLGPDTACCVHVDCQNCPYGFCSITALGNYDPKKGGHLILWDLRLVIEFPPGSTILIPSACLRHGNTTIQPGERRYSFTQYCPGPLIQWRRCGYRNVCDLTPAEILAIDGPKGAHREECQKLLSKYHELPADQQLVFGSQ
ncbi:hypothetical protein EWM64_g3417 [Hericium alpestre]|uniref:Uncharacterized protein n=1 Tax=Hericium alpestre TaxID=135208 RepID=A0A4Z0A4J4_9AGAM|nr:hypothetical protein EWM64_g3417 [Hericium alpestre]